MLVEQRWPNGKITSTIVDTSAAPLEGAGARLAWKRPISRALRLSRMSNSRGNLQLPLQAAADAQPGLCGGHLARRHPWRAPRRHHAEQRDSFGFIEVAKRSRNGSRKCV